MNKAEPCVLGNKPVSETIWRISVVARPSIRLPPLTTSPRNIPASSFFIAEPRLGSSNSSSESFDFI